MNAEPKTTVLKEEFIQIGLAKNIVNHLSLLLVFLFIFNCIGGFLLLFYFMSTTEVESQKLLRFYAKIFESVMSF